MAYVYDLVHQIGKRPIVIDRGPLLGKRAFSLYQYLKKTKDSSPEGEAAVLGCTVGGAIHRRTIRHLELVLVNNLNALQSGEITSANLADIRKYVWKLIAIGRRQLSKKNSTLVIPFLKEAFYLAEEAGLLQAAQVASDKLSILLGNRYLDKKEYHSFVKKAERYRSLNLELQQSILCFRQVSILHQEGEEVSQIREVVERRIKELENFKITDWHYRLSLMKFQLEIKLCEIELNPEGLIDQATAAIQYINENPSIPVENKSFFETYLGYAYVLTNDYERARSALKNLRVKMDPLHLNYGKTLELSLLLSFRAGYFEELSSAFLDFDHWVKYSGKEEVFAQSHSIFKAYLLLLIFLQKVDSFPETSSSDTRKLQTQLERMSRSEDATTQRHFRLISLIKKLIRKDYRTAREHWINIKTPKRNDGNRYKYFHAQISMLFGQELHRVAVERHAAKATKKMSANPLSGKELLSMQEIIPYEDLWQIMLGLLENKRIKLR